MSDQEPNYTQGVRLMDALEFYSKHFAAITAIMTVSVGLFATAFSFGYVSAFDKSLFALLSYGDILQFGLGAFSFSAVSILGLYLTFVVVLIRMKRPKSPDGIVPHDLTPLLTVICLIAMIYLTLPNGGILPATNRPMMLVSIFGLGGIFVILLTISLVINATVVRPYKLSFAALAYIMTFMASFLAGEIAAQYVQLTTEGRYNVTTRDDIVKDAQIIMSTARGIVVRANRLVTIIPGAEIKKIESRAK